jgi:hypothetical protein
MCGFFGNKFQSVSKTPECVGKAGIDQEDFHIVTNFLGEQLSAYAGEVISVKGRP